MDTKQILRTNGYAVDNSGHIECHRTPVNRWAYSHVGVIRINAPKDFAAKIIAEVDQPGACIGVSKTGAVMVFRIYEQRTVGVGSGFNFEYVHPFMLGGAQCTLITASDGQTLDVAAFEWRDRSPLTLHRDSLAPLFPDISRTAYEAVTKHGGTWGKMPDSAAEAAREERYEKIRQEIADGLHTPEAIAARADDELVARYAGIDLAAADGMSSIQVLNARKRVENRKRLALEKAVA